MALSPDEETLYVACADSSSVSVLDTQKGRELERIGTSLYPKVPNGSTPDSLALAANGNTLWIANADANNVAVFDVSHRGQSRSLGLLAGRLVPDFGADFGRGRPHLRRQRQRLDVEGQPQRPQSAAEERSSRKRNISAGCFRGALSVIRTPESSQMAALTPHRLRVLSGSSPTAVQPAARRSRAIRSRAQLGQPSPIKHCIYIIKENRTYDQVFGDLPQGNGEPGLCIFPERVTPNHHALARQFVLLDNFYVDGEVSANGHEWSMAAYATDYVEKVWPHRLSPAGEHAEESSRGFQYPSEGTATIACPSSGYLWDRCREASVSYRSYGEFIANGRKPTDPGRARVKALEGHFDPYFRGFDLDYSDQRRADRFIAELKRFEAEGQMPQLMIVRLPNDHTAGTKRRHADADRLPGRQRSGVGPRRRGGQPQQVLAGDGHLRAGRRRPERPRPRRRPSQHRPGDQSLHEAARGRFEHVLDFEHAADDGTDPGPEADDPVRCGRAADVRLIPGQARLDPLHAPAAPKSISTSETRRRPGGPPTRRRWTSARPMRPTISG